VSELYTEEELTHLTEEQEETIKTKVERRALHIGK